MNLETSVPGICSATAQDRHNQRQVTIWAAAWALSYVVVTFATKREWLTSGMAVAAALGTAVLGVATLLAYRRFLLHADELQRKIELEALAIAFGIGIVGGLTYWLMFEGGVVSGKGFSFVFGAMILSHAIAVVVGRRRYS
ncbi:MAG TPA: hypothetical protein VF701_13265 [Thermoanaerobaculia bacterium]